MLTRLLNGGRLCHAYLFYGKKGIGKKTFAKYMAAGVLCKSQDKQKPCGVCSSCKKLESSNHPDIFILDSKDAKNSIHIDTIRDIRQDAYIIPNESECKVYIIPNAHNMSISAFNALLKVLEEPPATAMFILTAESKSAVPETILSRCIPLAVYPLSTQECINALTELVSDKDEAEIKLAAEQSNGILGRALELLDSEIDLTANNIKKSIFNGIIKMNEYEILKALSLVKTNKETMFQVIDELMIGIRNSVMHKLNVTQIEDEQLQKLSDRLTTKQAELIVNLLQRASDKIQGNANIGILTGWISTEIMNIII